VDLNGTTAGTSFSHTWSSAQWVSPTNFVGVVGRASTTLLIDNLVVLQPAIQLPVVVQVERAGPNLQLTWSGGTLLESTNVSGPWLSNVTAASPYLVVPTEPQKFFKVRAQ
jgi:hypothetical protein